jgi:hypothetical protein
MTMPNEELAALKRSHKFLSAVIFMRKQTFRNMSVEEFEGWRKEAISCIRHFPFDFHLDKLYENQVCIECGEPVEFHKMGCSAGALELRKKEGV